MRTRPLSDPLWDHVMECAPCRIDVREMGRERPAVPVRSAARSVSLAFAVILVLIVGVGAWIFTRGSGALTPVAGDLRQIPGNALGSAAAEWTRAGSTAASHQIDSPDAEWL